MASEEEYSSPSLAPGVGCLYYLVALWLIEWVASYKFHTIGALTVLAAHFAGMYSIGPLISNVVDSRRKPPPEHWPFPSTEAYHSATCLANPFALSLP